MSIYKDGAAMPLDTQAAMYNSFLGSGDSGSYEDWVKGMGFTTSTPNSLTDYNNQSGLFGVSNGTWNNMGQAAGLLGTGYGLYDSLLGNKAKLFNEQIGMLKDQRAQNKKMIADRETYKQNIGSGLANAFANKPAVI